MFLTETQACNADIALLVDKSGSITSPEDGGNPANWRILKDFIYEVMRQTGYGTTGVQFAVTFFANNAEPYIDFNQCYNLACAKTIIESVNPPVGTLMSIQTYCYFKCQILLYLYNSN